MNKRKTTIAIAILSILLVASVGITLCLAFTDHPLKVKPIPNYYSNKLTSPYLPESMTFAGEKVPLDVYWVHEALDREMVINTYQHSKTLRIFKLSTRIFPVVEKILKEEGVPEDFKYLCVAESGLENVVSPASAAGYWQFMPATAKVYGLTVTNDIDERNHLEKATRAACKHLKKCKNQFGSWTLAAAAYNRGEGGLQAAITSQSCNNYWDLWLNAETSRYVFRILSFKLLFENPQLYGVELCPAQMYHPIPTKELTVTASIADLPKFAQEHNITYKELRDLNPWIRNSKLVVPSGKSYTLLLPEKSKDYYRNLFKDCENPFMKIGDTVPQALKN